MESRDADGYSAATRQINQCERALISAAPQWATDGSFTTDGQTLDATRRLAVSDLCGKRLDQGVR